ncbi:MAG TPA: alpha-ketoacid dehydrogenase subunit beta [Anaerolineae bacterium]|nr:alpha-ketoacid dehydrogenase subunit beta [Anaerolineae bacterium]
MRKINFCEALNEGIDQEMERDPSVFIYGLGVPDHKHIFGSTNGLLEKYGPNRVFDTPLSEDSMLGFGLGAAINDLRPIHVHIRVDFLLLAMNQLVNMISGYSYLVGGKIKVPIVIRAVVGRGWGQGFQHSKSLHSYFAHIPGLKVIMPTTPYDAKGLMIAAIREDNPVVCIEHRWLYWAVGEVPEEPFEVPIGISHTIHLGNDITILAASWMAVEAMKAAEIMEKRGVSVEVIDLRTIAPIDYTLAVKSVNRTGHCIVADNDWTFCGLSAEVAASISEKCFDKLKSPVSRIGWKHTPCPTVRCLENEFYSNAIDIIREIERKLDLSPTDISGEEFYTHEKKFKGPF